ncbi:MAG: sortase SrtB [Oscillospiraceae bacterium]|nr:sortase SrtB [Oscillospiraceae bacterium]
MKKNLPLILISTILAAGIGVILYPVVGNFISKATSSSEISSYDAAVAQLDDSERQSMLAAAEAYNATLSGVINRDAFSVDDSEDTEESAQYLSLLNVDGVMGYIDIPSIDVYLPIFHGTSEEVLQKGAGHLEGSALPIGGLGTNTVISAHRGLPSAKLFTDLDQLELGDLFYIHVLGETLAYQVDQVVVVEPSNTEPLNAVAGEDHATLMTCTPYGINSHRMLVRGIRVSTPDADDTSAVSGGTTIASELSAAPVWVTVPVGIALFIPIRAIVIKIHHKRKP